MKAQSGGAGTTPAGRLASMGITGPFVDAIVDLLPDPLFFLTPAGGIVHVNRAGCALVGSTLSRIVGRSIDEVLSLRPFENTVIAEALAHGVTVSGRCTVGDGQKALLSARPVGMGDERIVLLAVTGGGTVAAPGPDGAGAVGRGGDDHTQQSESDDSSPATIVATSEALLTVCARIERCAAVDSPVLIQGATGTGKSLFAALLHRSSQRRHGPYKTINCGAIPAVRLESELFGHAGETGRGAAASATFGMVGRAHRGTLVLDEVSELPPALQVKLLRFLETGDAWSVGASKAWRPDVRIIATTSQDLRLMIGRRTFREDLFYRLGVLVVHIPPLREHPDDIAPLVERMLDRLGERLGLRKRITPEALEAMRHQPFPGNVRELWNLIERLVLTMPGEVIDAADVNADNDALPLPSPAQLLGGERIDLRKLLRDVEAGILREALRRFGTQARAAKHLGVAQATIARKSKQYGLDV